jgi:hypothetical protein
MLSYSSRSLIITPTTTSFITHYNHTNGLTLLVLNKKSPLIITSIRALSTADSNNNSTSKSPLQRLIDYFSFRPGAPGYANYPRKAPVGEGYRYPSPGSDERGTPKIPSVPIGDDLVYNTQYYTRDTRRNKPPAVIYAQDMKSLPFPEKGLPPLGSPGRQNFNVALYDPSGSRSAMTTSHKAMNSALEAHRPNHLPMAPWRRNAKEFDKMVEDSIKYKIPLAVGVNMKTTNITDKIQW